MNICVIPARGGSKRIPRKNIKLFHGKPIIAYSIEAAISSKCFDRVIVSTDDAEIADIARELGASVPFLRPKAISDDYATTIDVLKHSIDWCEKNECHVELVCCVYATAPFLQADTIRESMDILYNNNCEYVFSVVPYEYPVQRSIAINENGRVSMIDESMMNARSQDLEDVYHDAGQFYWCKAEALRGDVPIFSASSIPYILSRSLAMDIDTHEDWLIAESLYSLHIK